jgi:hypothetical protein
MSTRTGKIFRLLAAWAGLLAGCTAEPTFAPPPVEPQIAVVSVSEAAFPVESALRSCASLQPDFVLYLDKISPANGSIIEGGFSIRLLYPEEGAAFAAPIIEEKLVIITHPDNPIQLLDDDHLRSVFEGNYSSWSELSGEDIPVEVWIYPEGHEIQTLFESALWGRPLRNSFAFLAPGPSAMLEVIGESPGRIGVLPRAWLDGSVKTVELNPDTSLLLSFPILALADQQPSGAAAALVACLQSGSGKKELEDKYSK